VKKLPDLSYHLIGYQTESLSLDGEQILKKTELRKLVSMRRKISTSSKKVLSKYYKLMLKKVSTLYDCVLILRGVRDNAVGIRPVDVARSLVQYHTCRHETAVTWASRGN